MASILGHREAPAEARVKVVWTSRALVDLDRIVTYLEPVNPWAAARIAARLLAAAESLSELPRRGRRGLVDGTRELVVYPYIMVYSCAGDVEILRVWHGAQDR